MKTAATTPQLVFSDFFLIHRHEHLILIVKRLVTVDGYWHYRATTLVREFLVRRCCLYKQLRHVQGTSIIPATQKYYAVSNVTFNSCQVFGDMKPRAFRKNSNIRQDYTNLNYKLERPSRGKQTFEKYRKQIRVAFRLFLFSLTRM